MPYIQQSHVNPESGFTLMELVVTITIVSVLILGVVLILDPLERAARARDTERINNLEVISEAIEFAKSEAAGADATWDMDGTATNSCVGEASQRVFVSVVGTDSSGTCASPPDNLPSGWAYRCAPNDGPNDLDGTGWLPIDLTLGGSAAPAISHLPIDPINTFDSGYFFAYVCDRGSRRYELTARLASESLRTGGGDDAQSTDGGDDPLAYETGSDTGLEPRAPVGYWTLNGATSGAITNGTTMGLEDSHPNGNDGVARNANMAGMQWQPGISGGSVELDGTDDYVDITDPTEDIFDGYTKGFSVSFWVNPDVLGATRRSFIRKYDSAGSQRAWFLEKFNATNIGLFLSDDGGSPETWDWENNLAFGWQQYALTWATNQKPILYRNGTPETRVGSDGTNLAGIHNSSANLEFGRGAAGSPWDGEMDEVVIFDRTLTQSEVQYIYDSFNP